MTKSIGRRSFGRSTGAVTVIEARVHRSSARNARVAFVVTALIVGLFTMSIVVDRLHPILAMVLGFIVGLVLGGLTWTLVRVWPVIRLIWWWAPEILLTLGAVYGWVWLAQHTNLVVRLVVVAVIIGVPAGVPWLRRRIIAAAWCVIVRHRLRTCFAQFIVANRSGSLPLILWARPTPVGERVWIILRPGLALKDLQTRLEKIAVACWADQVTIERASARQAGVLRVDVKRRQVLTADVGSPLVDLVDPDTPTVLRSVEEIPTALDLPDVPAAETKSRPEPTSPRRPAMPVTASGPVAAGLDGEDVTDWI